MILVNYFMKVGVTRKKLSKVTNTLIDDIYRYSYENGALGGKILGSGGGGFILLYVPLKTRVYQKFIKSLTHVPFQFDYSGSKVVVYEPKGF